MATASRAVWKSYLKLGAVSCGVKLAGASSEADRIHFRVLNRKDQLPIKRDNSMEALVIRTWPN